MNQERKVLAKSQTINYEAEDGDKQFQITPFSNRKILEYQEMARNAKEGLLGFDFMMGMVMDAKLRPIGEEPFNEEEIKDLPTPFLVHCLREITKGNGLGDVFDFQERGGQQMASPTSNPVLEARRKLAQKLT